MDANLLIAQLWLWIAKHDAEFEIHALHTKSTVADGPTRKSLDMVEELEAVWLVPCLPEYLMEFWQGPDVADLSRFGLCEFVLPLWQVLTVRLSRLVSFRYLT